MVNVLIGVICYLVCSVLHPINFYLGYKTNKLKGRKKIKFSVVLNIILEVFFVYELLYHLCLLVLLF